MKPLLVLFGVSNMLGEFLDCAMSLGYVPRLVVTNVEEQTRPRTKALAQRLLGLKEPPTVVPLDGFTPSAGDHYFLSTTSPARHALVAELTRRFQLKFVTMVHPTAHVPPSATVEEGAFVGAGSVVGSATTIGRFCFVNRGVNIGHDCTIEAFARLMPGCNIGGHVHIGTAATIGMGANVLQELEIGPRAFIAVGAAVTRDVPPDHFAGGNPARLRLMSPNDAVDEKSS